MFTAYNSDKFKIISHAKFIYKISYTIEVNDESFTFLGVPHYWSFSFYIIDIAFCYYITLVQLLYIHVLNA